MSSRVVLQVLASASGDSTIRIWSITSGACLRLLEGHTNSVLRVVFATRGTQLLSSGSDGLVKLWSLKKGECVNTIDAHDDKVWALGTAEDGDKMVTAAADGTITVWKDRYDL